MAQDQVAVRSLHQIAILASDLDRAVAFYRDTLGATVIATFPEPGLAFVRLGDVRLPVDKAAYKSGGLKPGGAILPS